MTQPQDANSILMGSGAPTVKFEVVGTQVTGTVTEEPRSSQQTNFRTKALEFWKDNSPKMQVIVRLSTGLRDPAKPDDDGDRDLYIKGKYLTNAVREAVRASGANGVHTGGILTVAYVGDGPPEPGLEQGPKFYQAHYQPPAVSFTGITPPTQQPAYPQQMAQPMPQQGYPPATPQMPAQPVYAPPPAQQPIYPQMVQQQMPAQPVYAPPPAQPMQQMPVQQPAPQQPAQPAPLLPTAATSDTPPPNVDPNMWARLSPEQRAAVAAASAQPAAGY